MPKVRGVSSMPKNKGKWKEQPRDTGRGSIESSMSPPPSSTSRSVEVDTSSQPALPSTEAKDYWCIIDGQTIKDAFKVQLSPQAKVSNLKDTIKDKKKNDLGDVDAVNFILWKRSILPAAAAGKTPITVEDNDDKLLPKALLSSLSIDENTYIIIQVPDAASKRDRKDDEGHSSKRSRLNSSALLEAIEEGGLTGKGVVNGDSDLSLLNKKDKVSLLNFMGEKIDRTAIFYSLFSTALELQGTNIKDLDEISAPPGRVLPVVLTNTLYVRQTYKELFDAILEKFEGNRPYDHEFRKHVVVSGTSGIGKSAFLVYFVIRLLAESHDDSPPLLLFHTKRRGQCFVFGGRSIVRSGDIKVFEPFLDDPGTWYLVDGSPDPELAEAKTIISASPKTLSSETQHYKDIDKRVFWRYYMAPWNLEELKTCRDRVAGFKVLPLKTLKELYLEIGGVPSYVLEIPTQVLKSNPNGIEKAKVAACKCLEEALKSIKDLMTMMLYLSQGKDTLEFGSRLIHRWPSDDKHSEFRMEWASAYVAWKVSDLLTDGARREILKRLIEDPVGSTSGIMFEAYVLRIFREGGYTFELMDLETRTCTHLNVPQNPKATNFHEIAKDGELWIPTIRNVASVDLLLATEDPLQVTVSRSHPIKGLPFLELITSLMHHHWIDKPEEARLIFVVPSHVYDDFQKQNYLTSVGKVYEKEKNVLSNIRPVKQYVLKIDVKSAAAGKSPGLEVPVQPVVPMQSVVPVQSVVLIRRKPPRTRKPLYQSID